MRVIGSILFDADCASVMAEVAANKLGTMVLNSRRWRPCTKAEPRAGDLIWVREPFVQFLDRKWGDDSLQFGSIITTKKPPSYARLRPVDYRIKPSNGSAMKQRQSRLTLEVKKLDGGVLTCRIHLANVANLLMREAA